MKKRFLRFLSLGLVLCMWIVSLVPSLQDAAAVREALSLLSAAAAERTLTDEEAQMGYIKVMDPTTGKKHNYDALLVEKKDIYMSVGPLANMTGYEWSGDSHSTVTFQYPGRIGETKIKVEPSGKVTINGETTSVDVVEYKDVYYFHANQILNLLGGEWFEFYERPEEEEEGQAENGGKTDGKDEESRKAILMYLPPAYNTFDFVGQIKDTLYQYQIHQDALVNSGDSMWGTAFASGLAIVFNDFDMRILIPVVGEGMIVESQYEEAFETLSVDDATFLTQDSFSHIGSIVEESDYETMVFCVESMGAICDIPEKIEKTTEGAVSLIKTIRQSDEGDKFLKFVKEIKEGLDETDLGKFTDVVGKVNTALDVISIFTTAYQAYGRANGWTSDQIDQLSVLMNLEAPSDKTTQGYVNTAARKLIMETKWPAGTALASGIGETIKLGAEFGIETFTPLGPIIGLIEAGVAIGKQFPSFARSIESNDLKYMVNSLIKTEALALSVMSKTYSQCIAKYQKGTLTENDLIDLKTKVKLVLRVNLRNASMIYYLNSQLEDAGWQKTSDAESLKKQIEHDYALLTELEHASGWDYLIRCSDWNRLVHSIGASVGDIRELFNEDIWYPVDMSIGNATNYVEYQGKVYFWGFSAENFSTEELWANYQPQGGIETKLYCIDANDPNAKPELVLTADGCGKIGIRNERLYFECKNGIKSILLDGTGMESYSGISTMVAADDEKGALVVSNGAYGGVGLLEMGSGELVFFDSEASFILVENGILYYYTNFSKGTVNIYSVSTDGTGKRLLATITQTLWTESELSSMTSTTIKAAQIADEYLYICYGSYAGTGMIFQGGEFSRIKIDDPEHADVESVSGDPDECRLYVSSVEKKHSLYYPAYSSTAKKNVTMCLNVADGTETETSLACYPKGQFYVAGNTICVHPDLSGSELVLIGPSDYSTVGTTDQLSRYDYDKEVIEVESIAILGDWIYYAAERSSYSDSLGWRYSYQREETVIFRKNMKTGVVQQLHSY